MKGGIYIMKKEEKNQEENFEKPIEKISLSYDERKRELTRIVETFTADKKSRWEITLKEPEIKKVYEALMIEKKDLEKYLERQESELDKLNSPENKAEPVTLTEAQLALKENIIALQKDDKYHKWKSQIDSFEKNIEEAKKGVSEKNRLINEIKTKAKNIKF